MVRLMYWHQVSNSTICQLIIDAWAKVSLSSVAQALTKAKIVTEQLCNSNEIDLDDDKRDPGILILKVRNC